MTNNTLMELKLMKTMTGSKTVRIHFGDMPNTSIAITRILYSFSSIDSAIRTTKWKSVSWSHFLLNSMRITDQSPSHLGQPNYMEKDYFNQSS
nr:hypothetical protein [Niallia taxi]